MVSFNKIYILLLASFAGLCLAQGNIVYATESMEPLPETVQEGNMYAVNPDGTGDFVSIQEGVDSVESGDTLIIYPGVYEENVIIEDKTVNLIGVSPKYCILMANSDNYHHIPLTIAAGRVSGLTICGTSTGEHAKELPDAGMGISSDKLDPADLNAIYTWQDQYPGYVIHVDDAYAEGKTLCIENCRIISENNYCIGIGCWGNTEITIADCELIAKGVSGCLFIHNNSVEFGPSQVMIKDTKFSNYVSPYVMVVHSEGESNPIAFTFQNVKVHTVAYENNDCYHESNINTWFPIDQIDHPAVRAVLAEEGYMSLTQSRQLVHQCTEEQHIKYNKELEEQDSLLKGWPKLAEGITYWESGSDMPLILGKTRHCIDMKNVDAETVGDGWCGLSGIYLTEDSYGNTLPEMNYPRPVIESESE
ncbi:MAG: hypothetical protein K2N44_02675 [Lachnospiraceae bacterium]|nr:hypothetical protein [Lachnospiraceae bacterium]